MEIGELEKLAMVLEALALSGAYGIMAKNIGEGKAEITHYLFPKFFPNIKPAMSAKEVGENPAYFEALSKMKAAGFEFDTADASGNFTGLARLVEVLPFALQETELAEIRRIKGFAALNYLIGVLDSKNIQKI
ncbi:MAG: hypothetical protein AABX01_06130 [Candidatus Micrarchaeota archaeon]